MAEKQLERGMTRFVRREVDILLATTIVESGLDIPNANTIFIHEADRYVLADLHQLRGRVGRFKNRAYAYMILEESKAVTPNAVAAKTPSPDPSKRLAMSRPPGVRLRISEAAVQAKLRSIHGRCKVAWIA